MEKSTQMGSNRTGMDTSPFDSKSMVEGAEKYGITPGTPESLLAFKRSYDGEAGSVGSVPIPGTPKGMVKSAMKKLTGHNPEMFINKLGERLAYERSGVRIYEAFIEKCQGATANQGAVAIPIERLQKFCRQEGEHMQLVKECLLTLGADPTAQTPDADVAGVASLGLMKVIHDPRTSIAQSLEAMLSIEMTDNAAWDLLVKLAEDVGMDDMADQFRVALKQEDIHLEEIRQWHETAVLKQAQLGA